MKLAIVTISLCLCGSAFADTTFIVNGKNATPLEATVAAMQNKDARVYKCVQMETKASKTGAVSLKKKE